MTKLQIHEKRKEQLKNERLSFINHWRDLGEYIAPSRPRFLHENPNVGSRKNQKIINSSGVVALRTLRSGMMAGITSPARPWFRLATPDQGLNESTEVKRWLDTVAQRMRVIFLRSNLYKVLPIMYGEMGGFGTSAIGMMEDTFTLIRFYPFPIGSYMLATDDRMKVNTFYREFKMTVSQIVSKFGTDDRSRGVIDWRNISDEVKSLWERNETNAYRNVVHAIRVNDNRDPNKLAAKFKQFSSTYYEAGLSHEDKTLEESGYDEWPLITPRWEVTGQDVYGTNCPGMEALGDIKQLQLEEKRKAEAIEKKVRPPMTGPSALRNSKASILPGDITFLDVREGQQGFKPVHDVNLDIRDLKEDMAGIQARISRVFFEDLFLMMASSDRREITAREIDERHEEKLLALGPVLEQLNEDALDPLIDRTFQMMLRVSEGNDDPIIPEAPEELQGIELRVEYISIMAQAQKLIGIAAIERTAGFVGQIAQFLEESIDKIDGDQMIDEYAEMTGVPGRMIRSDEEVEQIRAARLEAQQQAEQAERAAQAAQTASGLASADMSGDNALTRLVETANAGGVTPPAQLQEV